MSHPNNNNPNSYQRYNNNRGPPQGQDSGPYNRGNAHQQGNINGRDYNHQNNNRESYRSRDYTPREHTGRDYNSSYNNRRDYSNSSSGNNRGDYSQGYDRRDSRPQFQSRERFYDQRSSGGQSQQQHMQYGYPDRNGGSYGGYNQPPHQGGYGVTYSQPGGAQPRGFDRRRMENNRGEERSQQYYSSDRNNSNNGGYFEGYNNNNTNSRQVMGFYNQKRDFGRDQRSNLETLPIRIFHNWVKSVLIQKYGEKQRELVKKEIGISSYLPENYLYVLDVACGKGGDHKKWLMHSHTAFYVGVDIAFESLNEAHKRAIKTLEEIKMNSRYHSNIKFGFFGKDATCSREDFWKYIIRTPEEEAADPKKKLKGGDNISDADGKDKGDDGTGNGSLGGDKNYSNEEGEECKTSQDPKENIEQNKGEQKEQDGHQNGQDKVPGEVDLEDPIYNDQDGEVKGTENSSSEQQKKSNQSQNSTEQSSKNGSTTATNTSTMANPDQSTYMFDLASCQMSLHYMLETETSARNFLDNCTYKLNEKGYLLLTFTDASKIIELMKTHGKAVSAAEEDGPHVYKAKHFSLKFDVSGDQIEKKFKANPYGVKYDFYLQEAVGQEVDGQIQYVPEYLVDTSKLIELAKEFGMEVKENSNFVDFYQSNKLEFADLLRQMKVPFSTEEDTKDPDTWTISHCYRVLVFQKLNRGPRVKFDRSTRDKFLYKYPVPFNFFPKKRPQI